MRRIAVWSAGTPGGATIGTPKVSVAITRSSSGWWRAGITSRNSGSPGKRGADWKIGVTCFINVVRLAMPSPVVKEASISPCSKASRMRAVDR